MSKAELATSETPTEQPQKTLPLADVRKSDPFEALKHLPIGAPIRFNVFKEWPEDSSGDPTAH